jgi:molybdopterin-guanine dinucleotide biosynthesis protein
LYFTLFFCRFQLAADASNVVAMTEEEKKRLEEILSDMGDLMDEVLLKRFWTIHSLPCCRLPTALT